MWNVTKKNKICEICGKEFQPKSNSQKYCCTKCSDTAAEGKYSEYLDKRKKEYYKNKKIYCNFCGKEIASAFLEGTHRGKMHDFCRLKYLAEKKMNNVRLDAADRSIMAYHCITSTDIKDYMKNPHEWEV